MLKKTIKYTDYNGVERVEDFYFNLTKAEIIDMEMDVEGGMYAMLQRIISSQDNKNLYDVFKNIVIKAYGQKSPDGRRFIKNDTLREEFKQTEAYSILFTELATDAKLAADFVNGIIPNIEQTSIPAPNN